MPDHVTKSQRRRRGQVFVEIDAKHFAVAAELEQSVYRTGRTIGRTWPWLAMAIDMLPDCDAHNPVLSMARSAAHTLRRAGLRLDSPLISIPEPEEAEAVLGWCRQAGREPNSHWSRMAVLAQLDEFLALKAVLRGSRFLTISGQLSEEQKAAGLPDLFDSVGYDKPQILEIVPFENGGLRHVA